jgi:hypothetical protein
MKTRKPKITCDLNAYIYCPEANRHELRLEYNGQLLALLNLTYDELEDIECDLCNLEQQIATYRRMHTPQDI